jgi:hypothetical protein
VRRLICTVLFLLIGLQAPACAQQPAPLSDWAVAVVAGDWRAHSGRDTEAFDNARRDVAAALVRAGFSPAHVRQYSLRPPRKGDDPAVVTTPITAVQGLLAEGRKATGGCLLYVTSHGSPDGAVFGPDQLLTPYKLSRLLDEACGTRPTVVVISACFSGVFVPALAAPNRMVMTAARPDRSSFGCGDNDRYPFFDACVLESLPRADDFIALAGLTRSCVTRHEKEQKLEPPSEPQTSVGTRMQLLLPFLRFAGR